MSYYLFVDDERCPSSEDTYAHIAYMCGKEALVGLKTALGKNEVIWAKSVKEAQDVVKSKGLPYFMSLDHYLNDGSVSAFAGEGGTIKTFVRWLVSEYGEEAPPAFQGHSSSEAGNYWVETMMRSWQRRAE